MSAGELQFAVTAGLVLVQLLLFAVGIVVYLRLIAKLQCEGGQVRATGFELPDLLMSVVFATAFGGLALKAALRRTAEDAAVRPDQLVQGGAFLAIILTAGVSLAQTSGFTYQGKLAAAVCRMRDRPRPAV